MAASSGTAHPIEAWNTPDAREARRAEHERWVAAREATRAELQAQLAGVRTAWLGDPDHEWGTFVPTLLDVFAAERDSRGLEEEWIGGLYKWLRERQIKPIKRFIGDRKLLTLTCASCGEPFFSFRRDRRACSAACRQRLYRQRQKATAGSRQ